MDMSLRNIAHIGFNRAEGIIGCLGCRCLRQRIEEGRFADIGQADDTAFETHDVPTVFQSI